MNAYDEKIHLAHSNPAVRSTSDVSFEPFSFQKVYWNQSSISIRARECQSVIDFADNSTASSALDTVSSNNEIGFVGGAIRKVQCLRASF